MYYANRLEAVMGLYPKISHIVTWGCTAWLIHVGTPPHPASLSACTYRSVYLAIFAQFLCIYVYVCLPLLPRSRWQFALFSSSQKEEKLKSSFISAALPSPVISLPFLSVTSPVFMFHLTSPRNLVRVESDGYCLHWLATFSPGGQTWSPGSQRDVSENN